MTILFKVVPLNLAHQAGQDKQSLEIYHRLNIT